MYVGAWRELDAKKVIAKKLKADEVVYGYQPFFSQEFFEAYLAFNDAGDVLSELINIAWGAENNITAIDPKPLYAPYSAGDNNKAISPGFDDNAGKAFAYLAGH